MKTMHLSEEQFGDLLTEGSAARQVDARTAAHLAACSLCREELSGLRASLGLYRDTVSAFAAAEAERSTGRVSSGALRPRNWEERDSVPSASRPRRSPRLLVWSMGGLAATLVLVSATVGGLRTHSPHMASPDASSLLHEGGTSTAASAGSTWSQAADDDRLLTEIGQDLSTPLPPSLAPLTGVAASASASPPR